MYGISIQDKTKIDNNLKRQTQYLKDNELYNGSYNANIRPDKYISELYNRVNSINDLALSQKLSPVFITITAPSCFHPKKTLNKKFNKKVKYINNPKYNGATPKATALELSKIWARFLRTNIMSQEIPSNHRHYFRTYEPHSSGVPHIHALLYIPKEYINGVKQAFNNLMSKNHILQHKFIYDFTNDIKYKDNHLGAIAYIMKYINKTFKNSLDNKMGDVAYWYIKHNIRRFLTSRSLIPLMVFRKINYKEKYQDMVLSTQYWHNKQFIKSNNGSIYFLEYDYEEQETIETCLFQNKNIKPFISLEQLKLKKSINSNFNKPSKPNYIPLVMNDKRYRYNLSTGEYFKPVTSKFYYMMSDIELHQIYHRFNSNIENVNLVEFGVIKNMLIQRKIFNDMACSLNEYQKMEDFISN